MIDGRPEIDPAPVPAIAVWAAVGSVAFALVGVVWPHGADALVRVLLATLVVGFAGALAYRAVQSVTQPLSRSPFDREPVSRPQSSAPQGLRRLTTELNAAGDERWAERTSIPYSARLTIRREAGWRLAEHHGLRLDDPDHRDHIRALVSPSTWKLICPADAGVPSPSRGRRSGRRDQPVPLSHLGHILDDLEHL